MDRWSEVMKSMPSPPLEEGDAGDKTLRDGGAARQTPRVRERGTQKPGHTPLGWWEERWLMMGVMRSMWLVRAGDEEVEVWW